MIDQYPPSNGVLTSLIWRKTAVGGETSLSGYDNASQALSYTPGQEQVYLNGILLVRGDDYTATNGTSVTGLTALAAGDFVQINCYNNFSVAAIPATSITGNIQNSQLQSSSISINGTSISLGDSVSGLATLTGSETLTNKTLTAPVINLSTNAQTGTSYSLVLADASKIIELSNASAITLTVPLNSSQAFPIGTQITLIQTSSGQVTVSPAGGVTLNSTPGSKLRSQWSSATLIKRATDTWILIGDLTA